MTPQWEMVGLIGVDSGMCWIGDPGYVFHHKDDDLGFIGKNWSEFCLMVKHDITQFGINIGVCASNFGGDGAYLVYAKRTKNGTIKEIKIVFERK